MYASGHAKPSDEYIVTLYMHTPSLVLIWTQPPPVSASLFSVVLPANEVNNVIHNNNHKYCINLGDYTLYMSVIRTHSGFFLEIFRRGERLIDRHALDPTNVCA